MFPLGSIINVWNYGYTFENSLKLKHKTWIHKIFYRKLLFGFQDWPAHII